jgi:hypothetical protein
MAANRHGTACEDRQRLSAMPNLAQRSIPWKRLLLLTTLLLLATLLLAAAAAFQQQARVAAARDVGLEDVARVFSLLRTHDPRQARPGLVSTALVRERDLEVMLNQGAKRWLPLRSRVALAKEAATLQLSLELASHPLLVFGRWLNVEVSLVQTAGLPVIDAVKIGSLPIPVWMAERLAWWSLSKTAFKAEVDLAFDVVRRVRFAPQQLLVTYAWQGDSLGRLLDGLVAPEELSRLRAYSDRLVEVAARHKTSWQMPLVEMLQPAFELARQRTLAGGDAAAENRAALTVLTLHANGRGLALVLPAARHWPRPRPLQLLLGGRPDFPLHFLVSASLAAEGTTPLSKVVGVYKEVSDARNGSGFSFNDVAANRAGTRFGERLAQSPQEMQTALARGVKDADLLPRVDDLPEFMAEPEFQRRFGGIGAPAYNAQLADIDRRIAALPLLR